MIATYSRVPSVGHAASLRLRTLIVIGAGVLVDKLAAGPRRAADRLFAMNDAEACWRGWQIVKLHGGFGRRYRDPLFDTLTTCAQCAGQGHGIEEVPCLCCFGSGRLRLDGGVSS
jgi:hypothetical protein